MLTFSDFSINYMQVFVSKFRISEVLCKLKDFVQRV